MGSGFGVARRNCTPVWYVKLRKRCGNILEFELRETFYAGAMGQLFCGGGQRRGGGWSFRVRVGREVGAGRAFAGANPIVCA